MRTLAAAGCIAIRSAQAVQRSASNSVSRPPCPRLNSFRFLEQPSDPRVAAWTKQQALASERILEAIQGRSMIEQRLKSLTESMGVSASTPKRSANGRWFYTRRLAKENQASLVWRESQDKPEVLLVDSQALSKARGKPIAIQGFWPSDDGERLAYAIQEAGSEIGSLHVIDVASKRPLIEPIDRIRFASLTWDRSGEGFFFSRLKKDDGKAKASELSANRSRTRDLQGEHLSC
ncbi:MAG: hypothetical protein EBS75_06050 [Betaproteobacteria bacterium]|nr:hypothetical protein [Betaproteobacteria bacterium]